MTCQQLRKGGGGGAGAATAPPPSSSSCRQAFSAYQPEHWLAVAAATLSPSRPSSWRLSRAAGIDSEWPLTGCHYKFIGTRLQQSRVQSAFQYSSTSHLGCSGVAWSEVEGQTYNCCDCKLDEISLDNLQKIRVWPAYLERTAS